MNTVGTLLFRADADPKMGTGHIMRSLALAEEAKKRNYRVIYLTACKIPAILERIRKSGAEIQKLSKKAGSLADAQQVLKAGEKYGASWLITDGYAFGTEYQRTIRQGGMRLLYIDDYGHAGRYEADILLNHNLSAVPEIYRQRTKTDRLLLGTQYGLIRQEFLKIKKKKSGGNIRLLMTFGGSDPAGMTLKAIQALQALKKTRIHLTVVAGSGNSKIEKILTEIKKLPFQAELKVNAVMPELMAKTDLALTAAGSTCWELAFMGIPMITVVCADNQQDIAQALSRSGAAKNLGWHRAVTGKKILKTVNSVIKNQRELKEMSAKASGLVDGRGTVRIFDEMENL